MGEMSKCHILILEGRLILNKYGMFFSISHTSLHGLCLQTTD